VNGAVLLALTALASAAVALAPLPDVLSARGAQHVYDGRGELLRAPAGSDGSRAVWVRLEQVPRSFLEALIASEDHHIHEHPGVDPFGLLRALWLDVRAGRVVAGGSTLAMQLARLSAGLAHDARGKLEQALLGVVLQQRLGVDGVLEAYVNLAPFGRDVRGVAQASRAFFGKPLADLTRAEAVALACLPRAPSRYDPYRHPERLLARRSHVLGLLVARGEVDERTRYALANEPLSLAPFVRSFRAPHAVELARDEALRRADDASDELTTTIDPTLQASAEAACTRAVQGLAQAGATSCAAVIVSVARGEVRALVGSPDFSAAPAGQVNGAVALRQPGSALKPFVYALAFEGGKRPETPIVDAPTRFRAAFGEFSPRNYDGRFHGEVSLRRALACSYNVPAVKLADELGPARLLARLRALGLDSLRAPAEHYGVGLALGSGEVTLLSLTNAYAALARGGVYFAPTLLATAKSRGRSLPLSPRVERRVFSSEVSELVRDVLSDAEARRPAFGSASVLELPFPVAVKTGTSSSFRDNWALGYTRELAVGVWVGRHDGASLRAVSGVDGAAPALRHILLAAESARVAAADLTD
jgi:penicillin-binding protein 1C